MIKLLRHELTKKACYSKCEDIISNLQDAGCNEETIERCLEYLLADKKSSILQCLYDHRKMLVQQLHHKQKQLDCLDFLIYKLEKCHDRKEDKI